ncbi:MAG: EF-hand domain-containing protein [Pseudomonadota bacterium]
MFKRTLLSSAIVIASGLGASAVLASTEGEEWSDDTASETSSHTAEESTSMASDSGSEMPSFSELDTDGDGYLSEEEFQQNAELAELHAELDQDADGQVDESEFAALEQSGMDKESKSEEHRSDTEYESESESESESETDY